MPLKTESVEEPQLNLTPMLDVVLQLIIFFMVGTRFSELERQYDIQLPTVSAAQPLTSLPDEIVVNIDSEGQIVVGNEVVSLADLEERLQSARENYAGQSVVIRGDAEGRYQRVMDVLAICHRAQITNISLSNRLAEED